MRESIRERTRARGASLLYGIRNLSTDDAVVRTAELGVNDVIRYLRLLAGGGERSRQGARNRGASTRGQGGRSRGACAVAECTVRDETSIAVLEGYLVAEVINKNEVHRRAGRSASDNAVGAGELVTHEATSGKELLGAENTEVA